MRPEVLDTHTHTHTSVHDATRSKHRKLNLITRVSWESADVPKKAQVYKQQKTQRRKPPAAPATKKQQPPTAGRTATPEEHCRPASPTLALIQTKAAPTRHQ